MPDDSPFLPTGAPDPANETTSQIRRRLESDPLPPRWQGLPTWVPIVVSIMGTGLVAKVADILGVTELKAEVTELEKRIDKIEEHEKALMKTLEAIDDRSVETFNLATETYEIVDQAHPAVRDFGTHSPN